MATVSEFSKGVGNVLRLISYLGWHHGLAMVDFVSPLGRAMVPRYLLKHYSGCLYEGIIFWMILTFKSLDF